MTPEQIALRIACCTCWDAPPDNRGPLKDGSHYANCPSELVDDIADAIRAAERDAFRRAAEVVRKEADRWRDLANVPDIKAVSLTAGRATVAGTLLAVAVEIEMKAKGAELDRMASTGEAT